MLFLYKHTVFYPNIFIHLNPNLIILKHNFNINSAKKKNDVDVMISFFTSIQIKHEFLLLF